MARGEQKARLIKKAIISIAKDSNLTRKQYYKITNNQIWEWLLNNGHDIYITSNQIPKGRLKLPKTYRTKLW